MMAVYFGVTVLLFPPGHATVMAYLYDGHPGICQMKQLARSYVWWPNMDQELEQKVKECSCQLMQKSPAPKSQYIHGSGPSIHGHDYTLTMMAHSWVGCF